MKCNCTDTPCLSLCAKQRVGEEIGSWARVMGNSGILADCGAQTSVGGAFLFQRERGLGPACKTSSWSQKSAVALVHETGKNGKAKIGRKGQGKSPGKKRYDVITPYFPPNRFPVPPSNRRPFFTALHLLFAKTLVGSSNETHTEPA